MALSVESLSDFDYRALYHILCVWKPENKLLYNLFIDH